jgi:hypothetical protein
MSTWEFYSQVPGVGDTGVLTVQQQMYTGVWLVVLLVFPLRPPSPNREIPWERYACPQWQKLEEERTNLLLPPCGWDDLSTLFSLLSGLFLEFFYIPSKVEQKAQRFPIYLWWGIFIIYWWIRSPWFILEFILGVVCCMHLDLHHHNGITKSSLIALKTLCASLTHYIFSLTRNYGSFSSLSIVPLSWNYAVF